MILFGKMCGLGCTINYTYTEEFWMGKNQLSEASTQKTTTMAFIFAVAVYLMSAPPHEAPTPLAAAPKPLLPLSAKFGDNTVD
jgi:hypothetical protein